MPPVDPGAAEDMPAAPLGGATPPFVFRLLFTSFKKFPLFFVSGIVDCSSFFSFCSTLTFHHCRAPWLPQRFWRHPAPPPHRPPPPPAGQAPPPPRATPHRSGGGPGRPHGPPAVWVSEAVSGSARGQRGHFRWSARAKKNRKTTRAARARQGSTGGRGLAINIKNPSSPTFRQILDPPPFVPFL